MKKCKVCNADIVYGCHTTPKQPPMKKSKVFLLIDKIRKETSPKGNRLLNELIDVLIIHLDNIAFTLGGKK